MSKAYVFPALVSDSYEDGALWVCNFPSLNGCWVEGPTREDVVSRAPSVLAEYLKHASECGMTIPAPRDINPAECWGGEEIIKVECEI